MFYASAMYRHSTMYYNHIMYEEKEVLEKRIYFIILAPYQFVRYYNKLFLFFYSAISIVSSLHLDCLLFYYIIYYVNTIYNNKYKVGSLWS